MKSILEMWNECELLDWGKPEVDYWVKKINNNLAKYKDVEVITGVPAWLVGAIHGRECSFNLSKTIHNGDPWNEKTVNVPSGRGPFKSWQDAAVDALQMKHPKKYDFTKIEQCLDFAERYNGLGYRNKGMRSPYVWGLTNWQQPGKYIKDHVWDEKAVNKRPGVAAIAKILF